jgi:sugar transferase (PEP-CTERM/EpsH1 system associated)
MRILIISPKLPWPPFSGGKIRVYETLRYLSNNHNVTLITSVREDNQRKYRKYLQRFCGKIEVHTISRKTIAVVGRLIKGVVSGTPLIQAFHYDNILARKVWNHTNKNNYDIIQVEHSYMSKYIGAIDPNNKAKKILSLHNVESLRFQREIKYTKYDKRRFVLMWDNYFFPDWEETAINFYDGVVVVSEQEKKWIRANTSSKNIKIVPNGVDTKYFSPTERTNLQKSIVFTGLMDYYPNIDAVNWFCDEIWPILLKKYPNLHFIIVGSKPTKKVIDLTNRKGVFVTGEVEDVRSYIADSLAFIVPLRSGGGTRLKILQAMAMEIPVISTTIGAEGLEINPDTDILIADNKKQFIDKLDDVLQSKIKSKSIGKEGYKLVRNTYDWNICLSKLENFYVEVLGRS